MPGEAKAPRLLVSYLEDCRALVIEEIRRLTASRSSRVSFLYDLMLDYPLREAKGLRPAICIATCRALGGTLEAALKPAVAMELYHNAFLIHDDIEDESLLRRGHPTLHQAHGVAVAINVGDAMLALSLRPLLENIELVGLGPSLRVLDEVTRMAGESAEGQAQELDWIRRGAWALADDDYVRMVEQKTCWYSFITPITLGAIAARLEERRTRQLAEFARCLGIAFQIQDDVLNVSGEVGDYGKEIAGDLWEGKRTIILLHMLRSASAPEREEAERILALSRPRPAPQEAAGLQAVMEALVSQGELTPAGHQALQRALAGHDPRPVKTEGQVRYLLDLIQRYESVAHAKRVARAWLSKAQAAFDACKEWLRPSEHRDLLEELLSYVVERAR